MPHSIALQMNALGRLNHKSDTTLDLARVAAVQGHELFHYEPQNLRMDIDKGKLRIMVRGHALQHKLGAETVWALGAESVRDLTDFDVILMRQDPPFDLAYIAATHILEHLKGKVRVINDPVGVRNAPEKLLIAHFPQLMPPTLISRDKGAIETFRVEHGDIIIKPLFGYAGHGIFHLRPGDDNLPSLIELLSSMDQEPWMIQKFLPVAKLGDKRIVLLNGEPVGCFVRMPAEGDMRSNMRVGGQALKCEMTKRDHEICEALAPALREQGLSIAGIDIIGDYLTEINVTSPTGFVTVDQLNGLTGKDRVSERFWKQVFG